VEYQEKIQGFFEQDHFAKTLGVRLETAKPDYAVCSLPIQQSIINALGGVHGGAIFSLADYAFGIAANGCGRETVSLDGSISYFRPAKGNILYAEAKKLSQTRTLAFYQVRIYDDCGTDVASMQMTGYMTARENGLAEAQDA
jgi:acyl-CoA thioesterase